MKLQVSFLYTILVPVVIVYGQTPSDHYSSLRLELLKTIGKQLGKEVHFFGLDIPRRFRRSQIGEVFEGKL